MRAAARMRPPLATPLTRMSPEALRPVVANGLPFSVDCARYERKRAPALTLFIPSSSGWRCHFEEWHGKS